ncbi:hypothetical protein CEXT_135971 [Caerostris extrusa]|uniref:Uncharacterized protein n=1 Tax=Caerostris extrusa TaxID=172846 RepID=A0AAV4PP79_CAEEX|nr:hypothetical protein CEXT_135971 [Caerostris extrusa]
MHYDETRERQGLLNFFTRPDHVVLVQPRDSVLPTGGMITFFFALPQGLRVSASGHYVSLPVFVSEEDVSGEGQTTKQSSALRVCEIKWRKKKWGVFNSNRVKYQFFFPIASCINNKIGMYVYVSICMSKVYTPNALKESAIIKVSPKMFSKRALCNTVCEFNMENDRQGVKITNSTRWISRNEKYLMICMLAEISP